MMKSSRKGFTLIEILLVVVIIGIMLAVIVPRAWRANIDTKYGLVRQNCSELASFGQQWVEHQLTVQDPTAGVTACDLYATLTGWNVCYVAPTSGRGMWVASTDNANNWTGTAATVPANFLVGGIAQTQFQEAVSDLIAPEKIPVNPFNGASIFASANSPANVTPVHAVTGAIACAGLGDSNTNMYVGLIFQGTDNTGGGFAAGGDNTNHDADFHAGQGNSSLGNLRNGVFMVRTN